MLVSRIFARLLEGLLVLGIVSTVVFGVAAPLLGESGTGWYEFGVGKTLMSVQATLDVGVPVPGAPKLTSGAITPGSRGSVEMTTANRADVTFWAPTTGQKVAYLASPLLEAAAGLIVLLLLLAMVRSLRVDEPFTTANVYRTTAIGVTVAVAGTLGPLITQVVGNSLLESSAAAQLVQTTTFTLSSQWVLVGLIVIAIAEIFRRGAGLRRDVEGLV
jgi:hypothetical protein